MLICLNPRDADGVRAGHAAAANIALARGDQPFTSIEDLWRRSGAKSGALRRLAEADAFRPSMGLARREALWAIKALRDQPLPLFAAAAAREEALVPEIVETTVPLRSMSKGREVIEDYGHIGLSLRQHPLAFLRAELTAGKTISCEELQRTKDGRYVTVAGLVRQRPGSAKGVMFITIEDEGANANLIIDGTS
jgi:error-prone DNA polymerase